MSLNPIEAAVVDAFIAPEKRDRWRTKLMNSKKRRKFLDRLNHHNDFDNRYTTAVGHDADFAALLREHGAPERCHVVSDVADLDGRTLPLDDAINQMMHCGFGTVICCIPGELAFYYGELGETCLLLHRDRNAASQ
jgi:hypothetical protein